MAVDPATLLAEVEAAISACLTAQSYGIRGRHKQMANLAELRQTRKELLEEIAAASDGGVMCSLGQVIPPV